MACRTDDQPSLTPTVTELLYAAMSVKLGGLNNRLRERIGALQVSGVETSCHILVVNKAF